MQKNSELRKICKDFAKRESGIIDIVLFGSVAREKERPRDIDIALITAEKINPEALEKRISGGMKMPVHVTVMKPDTVFKETLWKTVIHEGVSLLDGRRISEKLGFEPYVMFWYNLAKLKASDKVRFSHALYGRGGSGGLLKKSKGRQLGRGVLLVPVNREDEMRDLFFEWGLPFERMRILAEK